MKRRIAALILAVLVVLLSASSFTMSSAAGPAPPAAVGVETHNFHGAGIVGFRDEYGSGAISAGIVLDVSSCNSCKTAVVTYDAAYYNSATERYWSIRGQAPASFFNLKADLSTGRVVATVPVTRTDYDTDGDGSVTTPAGSIYFDEVFTGTAPLSRGVSALKLNVPGLELAFQFQGGGTRQGTMSGTVPFDYGVATRAREHSIHIVHTR